MFSHSQEKAEDQEQESSLLQLPGFQQLALEPPLVSPAEQNYRSYHQYCGGCLKSLWFHWMPIGCYEHHLKCTDMATLVWFGRALRSGFTLVCVTCCTWTCWIWACCVWTCCTSTCSTSTSASTSTSGCGCGSSKVVCRTVKWVSSSKTRLNTV